MLEEDFPLHPEHAPDAVLQAVIRDLERLLKYSPPRERDDNSWEDCT
jgi:hypothetical protein